MSSADCRSCLLGQLSPEQHCPFRKTLYRAGVLLLEQDEVPPFAFYIRQGSVFLSTLRADGDEVSCTLRGPGSLIGIGALRGLPFERSVWALTNMTICQITIDELRTWAGPLDGPCGTLLMLAIDENARSYQERLTISGGAVERLARFLLAHLQRESGPLPFDHKVLARILGMRAETLSRVLSHLRRAGVIAPEQRIRVLDVTAIMRLVPK